MVTLSTIEYIQTSAGGRIQTRIKVNNQTSKTLWIEVGSEYSEYLTFERADAFIVGILNWAMREGHDIVSESPMGEYLYCQIVNYVIPGLCDGSPRLKRIKVTCPIDSGTLPNAGYVGTGVTCGVDSLYTIATNESDKFPRHKITHLTLFNVGSHGEGDRAEKIFKERTELAERYCIDNNYPLVIVNSNLHDIIKQDHFFTASYSACMAILALQKMWSLYYLASGGDNYEIFTLKDNDLYCSEDYELFLLPLLSTDQLRIESSGAGVTRQNKLKRIINFEPSYTTLNVCVKEGKNCGKCEKCVRTILGLDSLGALEKYSAVFDIDYYKAHKNYYHEICVTRYFDGWNIHKELYPLIKKQISIGTFLRGWLKHTKENFKNFISSVILKRSIRKKFK